MGHDWGALIGFAFVKKHVNTLEKYVMCSGPPREVWDDSIFASFKQFFMSWYVFFYLVPQLPEFALRLFDLGVLKLLYNKNNDNNQEEIIEAYKYTFGKENGYTGPINYYRENVKFLFPYERIPSPTNCVPGLYIIGEKDAYISPESGKLAMNMYEKLEFKIIKEADHFIVQNHAKETNAIIREFLSK
jgi:epoxide hydrolase 4